MWYTNGNQDLKLVMEVTADLEKQIIEAIPDWIEREPDLRRRLQKALNKTADSPPTFATFEEFMEWVDEDGRYHSRLLTGLWLQVDWLWLDPLPSIVDVFHHLELI